MKIGRNETCPCGSGKKYKKCCLGKYPESVWNGAEESKPTRKNDQWNMAVGSVRFDFSGLVTVVDGLENMPDLLAFAQRNAPAMLDEDDDEKAAMQRIMEEYNEALEEANSRLPKPYGVLLSEMKQLYDAKRYAQAVELADFVLGAWDGSEESRIIRDYALHELGRLPIARIHREILDAGLVLNSGREIRKKLLKEYVDAYKKSSCITQGHELERLCANYRLSDLEWERESCIMMMDSIGSRIKWLGAMWRQEFDNLILEALCDEFGAVRMAAIHCLEHKKLMPSPHEFFFLTYEKAKSCNDAPARKTLCNALLRQVYPDMDMRMEGNGKAKDYKGAIEYALAETGKDPAYYRLDWEGKMLYRLGRVGRKGKGKK